MTIQSNKLLMIWIFVSQQLFPGNVLLRTLNITMTLVVEHRFYKILGNHKISANHRLAKEIGFKYVLNLVTKIDIPQPKSF